jgi:hypothetical protein
LRDARLAEIEAMNVAGVERLGPLSEQAFLVAGVALYAGEGAKEDGRVKFSNSDPAMMGFFALWLRHFFDVDESRLRGCIYLHEGLDIDAATEHWAAVMGIPRTQFSKPYRADPDPTRRKNKHEHGCAYLSYSCSRSHRAVMGLVRALLSSSCLPG